MIVHYQTVPRRAGFTLVELLAAVAVLGLLAAFALPTLRASRAAAERTQCASNLRQIGLAFLSYANDHGGALPETTHSGAASNSWIYTLAPYLGNVDDVRICPADPRAAERRRLRLSSYVLNEFVFVDRYNEFGELEEPSLRHLSRIPFPARTLTAFTCSDHAGLSVYSDHTHSLNWDTGWNAVLADIQPDRFRSGSPAADRSRGSANYLYADGHVETLDASVIKARIDAGENPARPPS
jgi:prepilin-type N-terminal cleavage/methylation domain-containing protein/prepilin-type processing-associated H-X9-DG protein